MYKNNTKVENMKEEGGGGFKDYIHIFMNISYCDL